MVIMLLPKLICAITIVATVCRSVIALDAGDVCELRSGETGVCELLAYCPPAVMDLVARLPLTDCGFDKSHPIVCCKNHEKPTPATIATTTTTTTTTTQRSTTTEKQQITVPLPGAKCISRAGEYGVYQKLIDCPRALFDVRIKGDDQPDEEERTPETLVCCELLANRLAPWSNPNRQQLDEDCTSSSGVQGKCTLLADCQTAIFDLHNGLSPPICNIEANDAISVCCTPKTSDESPPATTATTAMNLNEMKLGDECYLKTGESGRCEAITKCSHVLPRLERGIPRKACGNDLNLVCCPIKRLEANASKPTKVVPHDGTNDLLMRLNNALSQLLQQFTQMPKTQQTNQPFRGNSRTSKVDANSCKFPDGFMQRITGLINEINTIVVRPFDHLTGDVCTLNSGNQGRCESLTNCKSALFDITNGIMPIYCNEGLNTVCCEDHFEPSTNTPRQVTGDNCSLSSGDGGECKLLSDCPQYLLNLSTNTSNICAFEIADPVVCCGTNASLFDERPAVRRAEKKCLEYRELAKRDAHNDKHCASAGQINDGEIVDSMEFPHMAAIGYTHAGNRYWACNGVLISERFVLTSAQCLNHTDYGIIDKIRLGAIDLYLDDHRGQAEEIDVKPEEFIYHPDYSFGYLDNDLALIRLSAPIAFTSHVRPACLYAESVISDEAAIMASGWRSDNSDSYSDPLYKISLNIETNGSCSDAIDWKKFKLMNRTEEQPICAKRDVWNTFMCSDDVGVALQLYNDDCVHEVLGVGISGAFCYAKAVGVFTRIRDHLYWIEDIVWPLN